MALAGAKRLDPEQRRRQLIDLGLEILSSGTRDVALDRIAEAAGISRGLLFHYFPTKRAYHVEVVKAAAQLFLDVTEPDESLPVIERLHASLSAYVSFVAENEAIYLAFLRGTAGGDAELQAVFDDVRGKIVERVVDALGGVEQSPFIRNALRGWVGFVEESTIDWLRHHDIEQERLVQLHEMMLFRALEAGATV